MWQSKWEDDYENKVIFDIKFHRYCDKHYHDMSGLASYGDIHRLSGLDYWNIGSPCNSADRMEHLYDYRF